MKRFLKYGVVPIVICGFLLIVTVMLLPVLINVQKFVPEIEEKISEAAGRSFSIGPDLGLSFFPWLSISFSDMKLGNPPGFLTDEFVKIDSFEARIKLLPLLKKEIRMSRFVIGGLDINFEKNSDGKINWEFIRTILSREYSALPISTSGIGFLRGDVSSTLLAVTDGRVNWIDRTKDIRHSVADLMILLNDVSVDHPIALDFKAAYDGKPIAFEGKIGPLRQKKGNEPLPVDFSFRIVDILQGRVQGKVENWRSAPGYDVSLKVASFSPRALFATLGVPFPVATTDPGTFASLDLNVVANGTSNAFTIEKGAVRLDDTSLAFSVQVKNTEQPGIDFFLEIDRLDLDRYLPFEADSASEPGEAEQHPAVSLDYRLLRNVISLEGTLKLQSLKVHGGTVTDINIHLGGKDGVFALDRASMTLYGGQLQTSLTANLLEEIPKTRVVLQSQGVQVETMLREFGTENVLSGTMDSDIALEFSGNTADAMRKTLSGEVTVSCRDGALAGIDLLRLMQSGKGADVGLVDDQRTARTDFSELKSVIGLSDGLLEIRDSTLTSSDAALRFDGTADLTGKQWDLRVVPMQPHEGQGDHARPLLPLTVTGPFANPEIKIDNRKHPGMAGVNVKKVSVAKLVDEKIPSPVDDDVKNLVGKALIDPAVVAQRFHLQPETIKRTDVKKQLRVGSGNIRIRQLQEEDSVR